ncbi:hypothetical protein [Streptomyces sp. CBMA29]|uniref:hypothetical protein n=1 Tax=Streptomyces sp. CBMA29 TaxID=1896314 RepID=UPI001661D5F6|nr:hypothetical protein [Streptomyces sp. CBMA29]MBD0736060.1 hypothetical protein [Streptomyces sp. CBMA29]
MIRLAERCALPALADGLIHLPRSKEGTGVFPAAKLMSLVGGMVAGADSIDDMDRLRHRARAACSQDGPGRHVDIDDTIRMTLLDRPVRTRPRPA